MLSEIAKSFGSLPLEARTELIQKWAHKYLIEGVDYIAPIPQECERLKCDAGAVLLSLTGIEKISRIVDRPDVYESAKLAFESLEARK